VLTLKNEINEKIAIMESPIILSSSSKDELNLQIDDKLRQRYQLKGGMQKEEDGSFSQEMIFPNNIDNELTLQGGIKLVVGVLIYITVLYFFL